MSWSTGSCGATILQAKRTAIRDAGMMVPGNGSQFAGSSKSPRNPLRLKSPLRSPAVGTGDGNIGINREARRDFQRTTELLVFGRGGPEIRDLLVRREVRATDYQTVASAIGFRNIINLLERNKAYRNRGAMCSQVRTKAKANQSETKGGHLCTRPEPPPWISASTSSTVKRLKSPGIECFRQDAATANSRAS